MCFVFCRTLRFEDKNLEERCWKVIEEQTEEALKSDEFVTVERSLVETVVEREGLNVKEVGLFKAVDRWATEQSKSQVITHDGESKRRILGEEIVKAIRFPLMSQQEFASVVIDSHILTLEEVGEMMKHFSDVSTTSLPFSQVPRIPRMDASILHRCHRFQVISTGTQPIGSPDCINFSVNKPIMLHGVQHFGSEGCNNSVSLRVKDTTDGSSLVNQSGTYASKIDMTCPYYYYGFSVLFDRPVCLVENKEYKIESLFKGPSSWFGTKGQASVECQGVVFTFRASPGSSTGTNVFHGQFPVLFWSAKR